MKYYTLIGVDGNAHAIMEYVVGAMRENNYSEEDITDYIADAKSSDYNHLVSVSYDVIEDINDNILLCYDEGSY